jgi:tRNA pseudouridine55 synthase
LLDFSEGQVVLDVRCSKGTYIRTLLEDIAAAVGQVTHLTGLRRYEVAPFLSPKMVTVEEVESFANEGDTGLDALLTPLARAFSHWASVRVDPGRALILRSGQPVRTADAPEQGQLAVLDEAGDMLCIAEIDPNGLIAPKRWLSDWGETA